MITRCEVTEEAAKLSLQLEAYSIPDDFNATGKYWHRVAEVRQQYTNFPTLLEALPACPGDCPLLPGKQDGARCFSRDFAYDMLEADARQLAMCVYDRWSARREKASGCG
jgi:hypothetical protein